MTRVDAVTDGLADEVRSERPAPEAVPLEELPSFAAVGVVHQRAVDLEVIAPAGEFEPVEPPAGAGGREIGDRQVRPLAGEQRDRSGHRLVSLIGGCRLRVESSSSNMSGSCPGVNQTPRTTVPPAGSRSRGRVSGHRLPPDHHRSSETADGA